MNRILVPLAFICLGLFLAPLEPRVAEPDAELAPLGTCSITPLPTSGTITASRLNGRYSQIESCLNGNIDNTNWDSSGTGLANSNLAAPNAYSPISVQLDCSATQASAFMSQVPASSTLTDVFVRCVQCSSSNIDVDIQIGGTTQITFAGIAGSTLQSSTGNSYSLNTATDLEVDITVTSAPATCWLDVTMWVTTAHTAN